MPIPAHRLRTARPPGVRSTPPGLHRPVMPGTVLSVLAPQPGETVLDGTVGLGGHTRLLAEAVGPTGRVIGLDRDGEVLARAQRELAEWSAQRPGQLPPIVLRQANFAAAAQIVAELNPVGVDVLLLDLGVSSPQLDDPGRGFSYKRDGPLDMRMDRRRGRSAAELLGTLSVAELARGLAELSDEPDAEHIARTVLAAHRRQPLLRTAELAELISATVGRRRAADQRGRHKPLHPAARTFQALRMMVNRELDNLAELLRVLPGLLTPGGRAAVISFHSGEDRRVKRAFRAGIASGVYRAVNREVIRPSLGEVADNPRSRSARLRWVMRAENFPSHSILANMEETRGVNT